MEVKLMGSTHELLSKLQILSGVEVGGIPGVAVECVDIVQMKGKFYWAEAI